VFSLFTDSPFYLTGGTALSRGYYNHRYSEDLDYFVNFRKDFSKLVDNQLDKIKGVFDDLKIVLKDSDFCRIFVSENRLKIEMINDVLSHVGEVVVHPVLGRVDSKENILANKITAVVDRALPKDIVDVYFLLEDGQDVKRALLDADSKAAGISPLYFAKKISEFDYTLLDSEIKWIAEIESGAIADYMKDLAIKIASGKL